jgi:hypothetical protein
MRIIGAVMAPKVVEKLEVEYKKYKIETLETKFEEIGWNILILTKKVVY